jgi:hypothetical protein
MYIIDRKKQIALINEMKQLRKDSKNYEAYYHHPVTNQMWKSFFPQADGEAMGPKLLRHEPVPGSIEEQFNICLTEEAPENAIGLGIEWTNRSDLWPEIMNVLEQNYSHYSRSQLKLFLKHLTFEEAEIPAPDQESSQDGPELSDTMIDNLVWRSKKIRLKRFFVFG